MTVSSSQLNRVFASNANLGTRFSDNHVYFDLTGIQVVEESSVVDRNDLLLFYFNSGGDITKVVTTPTDVVYSISNSSSSSEEGNVREGLRLVVNFTRVVQQAGTVGLADTTAYWTEFGGGKILVVRKESQIAQDYEEGDANGLELQLDKVVGKLQDTAQDVERTVRFINEDGTSAVENAYIKPKPNSVLHFDDEGNPQALHIGDDTNQAIRSDLGDKGDMRTADTAFGRIAGVTSDLSTEVEARIGQTGSLRTDLGNEISTRARKDTELRREITDNSDRIGDVSEDLVDGDPIGDTIYERIAALRAQDDGKLNVSVFTFRLYRLTASGGAPGLVTFGVNPPVNYMQIRPDLNVDNSLTVSLDPNDDVSLSGQFGYVRETSLASTLSSGGHVQAVDIEFHATRIHTAVDTNFIGGLHCIPVNWSTKSFRITSVEENTGLSATFIRQTIVEPALNIHNQDSNAHPALSLKIANNKDDLGFKSQDSKGETVYDALSAFSRIRLLRESAGSGGGGGGGGASASLNVLEVNDGVTVFDSIDTVPDRIYIVVQSDVDFHRPLRVRPQGSSSNSDLRVGRRGSLTDGISSGIADSAYFLISSTQRTNIENAAQSNRGTVYFEITGSRSGSGRVEDRTVETLATFTIQVGRTLEQTFGTNNLTDILTRGLPMFMRNMFNTIFANTEKTYRAVTLFGGIGNASVNPFASDAVADTAVWDEYRKAEWLYIYFGPATDSVTQAILDTTGNVEQFRLPLASMNRDTGAVNRIIFHFQRQGNINSAHIYISMTSDRKISWGGSTVTPGDHVLWAVAYVPSYSFALPDLSYTSTWLGSQYVRINQAALSFYRRGSSTYYPPIMDIPEQLVERYIMRGSFTLVGTGTIGTLQDRTYLLLQVVVHRRSIASSISMPAWRVLRDCTINLSYTPYYPITTQSFRHLVRVYSGGAGRNISTEDIASHRTVNVNGISLQTGDLLTIQVALDGMTLDTPVNISGNNNFDISFSIATPGLTPP